MPGDKIKANRLGSREMNGEINSDDSADTMLLRQIAADLRGLKEDRTRIEKERSEDRRRISELSEGLAVNNQRLSTVIDNYQDYQQDANERDSRINNLTRTVYVGVGILVAVNAVGIWLFEKGVI